MTKIRILQRYLFWIEWIKRKYGVLAAVVIFIITWLSGLTIFILGIMSILSIKNTIGDDNIKQQMDDIETSMNNTETPTKNVINKLKNDYYELQLKYFGYS